jgi:hypothetical protein
LLTLKLGGTHPNESSFTLLVGDASGVNGSVLIDQSTAWTGTTHISLTDPDGNTTALTNSAVIIDNAFHTFELRVTAGTAEVFVDSVSLGAVAGVGWAGIIPNVVIATSPNGGSAAFVDTISLFA